MSHFVIPLESTEARDSSLCGNKAASLSTLINKGINVPSGFCITADAYRYFVKENELSGLIVMETGRKPLEQMRWEEMWDAALRIRNGFIRSEVPDEVLEDLEDSLGEWLRGKGVAVRSSSLLEDAEGGSFAGLHESVINVRGLDDLLEAVMNVWASLWSDTVLAYAKELQIEEKESAMAVVVQEMVEGERSGVAFGVNPNNRHQSVIEGVFGLNSGMVDGEVQPDRWILDRGSGSILSVERAEHDRRVVADKKGVRLEKVVDIDELPLTKDEAAEIYRKVMEVEKIFGSAQDVEWTIREGDLYLLQSRPITAGEVAGGDDRRSFDLSLKKSFHTLREMSTRMEDELIPRMISEADKIGNTDPESLDDRELADEIARRETVLQKWEKTYRDEFIPFAHGVRLFGRVYNDRIKPDDPYEFVDLLSASETLSVKRNRMLESLAAELSEQPGFEAKELEELDSGIRERLENFLTEFGRLSCEGGRCKDEKDSLFNLVREMARRGGPEIPANRASAKAEKKQILLERFMDSFAEDEKGYAGEVLEIARQSYRLRDDDNIYLGRFETALSDAMKEAGQRLGARCTGSGACGDPEEVKRALRYPGYTLREDSEQSREKSRSTARVRQLRGQPAGGGIARGKARVIESSEDLFRIKKDEILVCDAIDPNMTFVIPLVSGIVERRGGMLVHGAIVAREYGLPCVTGVTDATRLLENGDNLTVDGYDGLVIIHREEVEDE